MKWKGTYNKKTCVIIFLFICKDFYSNAVQQKTPMTPAKSAQTELIITELKKFFTNNVATVATKGKLNQDVKEVTKIEMRNDLSKKQLLYILLVCLLEDTDSLLPILKSRHHLFKTVSASRFFFKKLQVTQVFHLACENKCRSNLVIKSLGNFCNST